jgi:hypothetical protein
MLDAIVAELSPSPAWENEAGAWLPGAAWSCEPGWSEL